MSSARMHARTMFMFEPSICPAGWLPSWTRSPTRLSPLLPGTLHDTQHRSYHGPSLPKAPIACKATPDNKKKKTQKANFDTRSSNPSHRLVHGLCLCSVPNAALSTISSLSPQPPKVNSPHAAPTQPWYIDANPTVAPSRSSNHRLILPQSTPQPSLHPGPSNIIYTQPPTASGCVSSSLQRLYRHHLSYCAPPAPFHTRIPVGRVASQGFMKRIFSFRAQPPAATAPLASSSTRIPQQHTRLSTFL
jgi:hypothetical protein